MGHSNLPFPLLLLLLSLLLLFLYIIPSHASPSPTPTSPPVNSTSCAPSKCGSVNISYPFYLSEAPTIPSQYCGYLGMGVFCDQEETPTPILFTQNGNYTITGIDYHSRIVSPVDTDFLYPSNPSCLRVKHNFTFFNNSILRYTNSDANITFLFNCSPPLQNTEDHISCLDEISYVFHSDLTEVEREYHDLIYTCKEIIVAPVLSDKLSSSNLVNQYNETLREGFELTWADLESDNCKICEQSGRRCGFNFTLHPLRHILRVKHNFTFFSNSTLNYTRYDTNLTFIFNCSALPNTEYLISCLGENSYVFHSDLTEVEREYDDLIYTCQDIIVAPVLAHNLPSSNLVNQYNETLREGFELTWGDLESDDCKICEQFGRRCGFNQTNGSNWAPACFDSAGAFLSLLSHHIYFFTCFCSDERCLRCGIYVKF